MRHKQILLLCNNIEMMILTKFSLAVWEVDERASHRLIVG